MLARALQPLRSHPPMRVCDACGTRLMSSSSSSTSSGRSEFQSSSSVHLSSEWRHGEGKQREIVLDRTELRNRSELTGLARRPAGFIAVPYSTSRALSSRTALSSSSTRVPEQLATVPLGSQAVATTLADLEMAITSSPPVEARAVFNHLTPHDRASLPRSTFDDLFLLVAELDSPQRRTRRVASAIKALHAYAKDERRWRLTDQQTRIAFQVMVRWEEIRRKLAADYRDPINPTVEEWNTQERERARRAYLDQIREEFVAIRSRGSIEFRDDRSIVERCAAAIISRDVNDYQNAAEVYARAGRLRYDPSAMGGMKPSSSFVANPPMVTPAASTLLLKLFQKDSQLARRHLGIMLDRGQLPSFEAIKRIMFNSDESSKGEEDVYMHYRQVLDAACDPGSRSGTRSLDALLEERLAQLDRTEEFEQNPWFAFLQWLSSEREDKEDMMEWLLVSLRLWKVIYADHGNSPTRYRSRELLDDLIRRTLPERQLDPSANARPAPAYFPGNPHGLGRPSRAVHLAIRLALDQLSTFQLVTRAHRLLQAITVSSLDRPLARKAYMTLREKAPLDSQYPFRWTAALRPTLVQLILLASPPNPPDPDFILQLYLDWTACGMTFPVSLYPPLWRALGRKGTVEDLARVIDDYETSGRGRVEARIISFVLLASTEREDALKTLPLLEYFRNRSPVTTTPIDYLVPRRVYEHIMWQLASSTSDQRPEVLRLFKQLTEEEGWKPRITTWNAILASHVFRPSFTPDDLEAAGKTYDLIVRRTLRSPDSATFSLVLLGFVRMAKQFEGQTVTGVEAGLKTVLSAFEKGRLVRGHQVAELIGLLGQLGRYDQAKMLSEQWWAKVVSNEREGKGRVLGEEEMERMRGAIEELAERESGMRREEKVKGMRQSKRNKSKRSEFAFPLFRDPKD
ncbi:BQ5605_C001g00732 [Microbotryum silenes-dioicae]|uniref:BQ5605_C001g00732 protein n=1 Tax=Microbotryum silenes-dioicae TaxID=796604 RepID=A0A2X0MRM5_9BASI|nr:BQ5605_C001g00732 [Microbotryum silenes-dioicae]